ncbi:hypothetical protein C5L29_000741 [Lactiplantibacillus pentosus]|jgi:hypothetical protein|nr:hypothetical protein C5L29_000741 [Lactiplantibacillus pentosus]
MAIIQILTVVVVAIIAATLVGDPTKQRQSKSVKGQK